jgi:cytochrome c biogenesis protein
MDGSGLRDAAMKTMLKTTASLKLTMVGIAALIANSFAVSQWPDEAIPWLVLPLSLLAVNLLAALLVRHAFRHQAALLLFHVGLLAVLVLVAAGVLIRFDGSVEVVEGTAFDAADVTDRGRGWLHPDRFDRVQFTQGPVEVHYLSGLRRDTTLSQVAIGRPDDGEFQREIGDRQGFTLHGYRFMTTFNKGYSVLLLWRDEQGRESLGAVNFPSYPKFDWKQINDWITPAGETLSLELLLADRVPEAGPWTLRSRNKDFSVSVNDGRDTVVSLRPGLSVAVKGGEITPLDVRLWMGYRIDYNPLLPWLIAAAFLSLGALAVHVAQKFSAPRVTDAVTSGVREQAA